MSLRCMGGRKPPYLRILMLEQRNKMNTMNIMNANTVIESTVNEALHTNRPVSVFALNRCLEERGSFSWEELGQHRQYITSLFNRWQRASQDQQPQPTYHTYQTSRPQSPPIGFPLRFASSPLARESSQEGVRSRMDALTEALRNRDMSVSSHSLQAPHNGKSIDAGTSSQWIL